ncbi:EamA family transporter [Poseidonibacter lekithochrous]|uniref:EamA family transporter n=1 Tax=Poseidonibacter TaxID=2321187 RepID=UPI001C09BC86|nr:MULTISPECIES: EamA family transporter [Poseidonibacter]MBU3015218.1 EamA family transporter [Poseidonibacter lekithochrous]MDO6828516.1 EamA family transporter [Poseidonibacter sp. 1_MG-2023]
MTKRDLSIALFITFIWGINFSFIKLGLSSLDPFMLAALRFFLCCFPLVFFIKKPDVEFKYIVSYGLLFGVGLWGVLYLGMYFGVSAGVASIVLQLGVFLTVILSYIILNEKIYIHNKIAFIIALIGIFLIFLLDDGTVTVLGMMFVILSSVSFAFLQIIVKKAKTKDVFSFLVYSTLFPPIPLLLLSYITNGDVVFIDFFSNIDSNAIISILFQVYPTTLFGYYIWNILLNKYKVSQISPLSLLIPIFGLLGSYLFFNEEVGFYKILASLIIVLGLVINTFGAKVFTNLKRVDKD